MSDRFEADTVEGRLADLMGSAVVRLDEYILSDHDRAIVIAALRKQSGTSMSDVTVSGKLLIDRWLGARESVARVKSELTRAQCELSDSETELAKWLMPGDVKAGEKISVWHGDSLIQVEVMGTGLHPIITVRQRGRALNR